jgi:hypothetical protein
MRKLRHEGTRKGIIGGDIDEAKVPRRRLKEHQVSLGFWMPRVVDDQVEEDEDCGDGQDC